MAPPSFRQGPARNLSEATVLVEGLLPLRRALRRTEGDLPKFVRKGLSDIGDHVKSKAEGNISNKTGRHGKEGRLADNIRKSVTLSRVSVYSNLEHSRVQDQGGRVGRNRATLLKRADVSQYMTRAVQSSQPEVEKQINELLDRVERDFGSD